MTQSEAATLRIGDPVHFPRDGGLYGLVIDVPADGVRISWESGVSRTYPLYGLPNVLRGDERIARQRFAWAY